MVSTQLHWLGLCLTILSGKTVISSSGVTGRDTKIKKGNLLTILASQRMIVERVHHPDWLCSNATQKQERSKQ